MSLLRRMTVSRAHTGAMMVCEPHRGHAKHPLTLHALLCLDAPPRQRAFASAPPTGASKVWSSADEAVADILDDSTL